MVLGDIDFKKIRLNNGKTVEQQMKVEAQRFLKILQEEIDLYYLRYNPVIHQRTYAMRNAVYAEDVVDVSASGTELVVRIKFTNEAYHQSLWGDGDINTLTLLNTGYQVRNGWHKDIEHFGYRGGGHFLERAVERFKKETSLGVSVKFEYT